MYTRIGGCVVQCPPNGRQLGQLQIAAFCSAARRAQIRSVFARTHGRSRGGSASEKGRARRAVPRGRMAKAFPGCRSTWGVARRQHPAGEVQDPDEIVGAIQLTEFGNKVLQKLVTKNEVPAKEARLLCFLRLAHLEPLVDVERTDLDELRRIIDKQIRDQRSPLSVRAWPGALRPAAELYEDMRDNPVARGDPRPAGGDADRGLSGRNYVTGPYGLLRSPERRWFGPY